MTENLYEMVLITDATLESSQSEATVNSIVDHIKTLKGNIEKVDNWGRRQLAYKIKKFSDGIYSIIKFTSPPESIEKLSSSLKINERVIRHLIVRLDSV